MTFLYKKKAVSIFFSFFVSNFWHSRKLIHAKKSHNCCFAKVNPHKVFKNSIRENQSKRKLIHLRYMQSEGNVQLLQLNFFFSLKIDDDDDGDGANFLLNTEIVQDLTQHVKSFSDALQQLRNTFKDGFIGMYI